MVSSHLRTSEAIRRSGGLGVGASAKTRGGRSERRLGLLLARSPMRRSAPSLLPIRMIGSALLVTMASSLSSLAAESGPEHGSAKSPKPAATAQTQAKSDKKEVSAARQPSHFDLGKVHAGAAVEISARMFGGSQVASGLAVKASPPAFLKLDKIAIAEVKNGKGGVACDVFLTVDTSKIGAFSGAVRVDFDDTVAEWPVSLEVIERPENCPSILIVTTPFDRFATSDGSHFEPLVELVDGLNISANYCREFPNDSAKFDVIFLAADKLCQLNSEDLFRLKAFVSTGGRLIIAANAFFRTSVSKANELLSEFGLEIEDRDAAREVTIDEIVADNLTEGVRRLEFFRPSLVKVIGKSQAKILVPAFDGGFVAVARTRNKGEVVVLTQSLWWNWITKGPGSNDNARLLANLLTPD